ncbi:MAG: DUF2971 domain-containing protein [Propionivibrio sp.]
MSERLSPKRLFKYRAFNVNSLRLLSEAEAYYANPSSFNDPLDSSPTIQVDTDRATLEKLLFKMLLRSVGKEQALSEIGNHRYMSTELGDYKVEPKAEAYYVRLLASNVKDLLYAELGKRGVLSFAERWDCPLMWSHYADEHRGLCIEYDASDSAFVNLRPVDYRRPRSIKVSDLIEWKIKQSASARQKIAETFFLAKAPQWRYEREWRDVTDHAGSRPAPARVSAVYFGLRCDTSVITAIVKLHASSEPSVKFYAIYPLNDGFRLRRSVVDTNEIEAIGLRSSAALDFRDVFVDETDASQETPSK